MHDEFFQSRIPVRNDAASLKRNGRVAVHAEAALQPHRTGAEQIQVAGADRASDEGVVGPVLEEPGTAWLHRRHGVDDGREFVDLDFDALRQIFGARTRCRYAGRYRLADIADLPGRQGRVGRLPESLELGARLQDIQIFKVVDCENALAVVRRLVHRKETPVSDAAAHKGDVLQSRQADVRDEHGLSGKMSGVLLAKQTRAYPASGGMRVTTHRALSSLCRLSAHTDQILAYVRLFDHLAKEK
ncbi:MAG: hypothetical protein Q7T73_02825 [Beijerinckiaceae bacterium]|nr:hypothetical protein [Beijerinckiaceae bacterium]